MSEELVMRNKTFPGIAKILVIVLLGFMVLAQIFPLVWLFSYSIKKSSDLFGPELLSFPKDPQWINYYRAFTQGRIPV